MKTTQHPSKKSSSSSHLLFLEHHFEFLFFFFGHSCTREKPIISQWRGRFRLRQTLFSLRFLLHCRPPHPTLDPPPFPFFLFCFLPRFVELKCSSRKGQ